jgi:hypothetical protein
MPEGTEENQEKPVRIFGVPGKIRTEYTSITSIERCRYVIVIGVLYLVSHVSSMPEPSLGNFFITIL